MFVFILMCLQYLPSAKSVDRFLSAMQKNSLNKLLSQAELQSLTAALVVSVHLFCELMYGFYS